MLFAAPATVPRPPQTKAAVIAVLENESDESDGLRPVFVLESNAWISLAQERADVEPGSDVGAALAPGEWHVCRAGKTIGTVGAVHDPDAEEIHHGRAPLAKGSIAPRDGRASTEFANEDDDPIFRPLVAVHAGAPCADPEHWKRAPVEPPTVHALMPQLREATKGLTACNTDGVLDPAPYDFKESEVHVTDGFAAKDGRRIVSLQVVPASKEKSVYCDIRTPEWGEQVFLVDAKGNARFLGSEIRFVDAVDADRDGRSELVFAILRENLGGYLLVPSRGDARESSFTYH